MPRHLEVAMLVHSRSGKGRTLVLIHGLLGSQDSWHYIKRRLVESYDVIAVSLPGHGGSEVPGGDRMRDAVDAVAEVLDEYAVKKATWIGHSWGGYVVAEAIASIPKRVAAGALVFSSPYPDSAAAKERRTAAIERTRHEAMSGIVADLIPPYFDENDPSEQVDFAVGIANQASAEGLRFALSTIRERADNSAALDGAKVPVLVIEGEKDPWIARMRSTAEHVDVVRLDTSHMGVLTDPDLVTDTLLGWLRSTDSS